MELGRRDTGWTMRISAAAPATGTKNVVESFSVSMRVQKATHWKRHTMTARIVKNGRNADGAKAANSRGTEEHGRAASVVSG